MTGVYVLPRPQPQCFLIPVGPLGGMPLGPPRHIPAHLNGLRQHSPTHTHTSCPRVLLPMRRTGGALRRSSPLLARPSPLGPLRVSFQRTSVTAKERGGALVTEFNPADLEASKVVLSGQTLTQHVTPPEELWANLEYFLKKARASMCIRRGAVFARASMCIRRGAVFAISLGWAMV